MGPIALLPRQGLSPRVRGNREPPRLDRLRRRSIPARAGEPRRPRRTRILPTVYPRACGGTTATTTTAYHDNGLSPRVRGNRYDVAFLGVRAGSIPARAGEPQPRCVTVVLRAVYPRACGGTSTTAIPEAGFCGLSPRVRGNQRHVDPRRHGTGSIPARAGEPLRLDDTGRPGTVYPRACGGTHRLMMY